MARCPLIVLGVSMMFVSLDLEDLSFEEQNPMIQKRPSELGTKKVAEVSGEDHHETLERNLYGPTAAQTTLQEHGEWRARETTMTGAATLGDVIDLARLLRVEIDVPSDVDRNLPLPDPWKSRVSLHDVLKKLCQEHNLTITYSEYNLTCKYSLSSTQAGKNSGCQSFDRGEPAAVRNHCQLREYGRSLTLWPLGCGRNGNTSRESGSNRGGVRGTGTGSARGRKRVSRLCTLGYFLG